MLGPVRKCILCGVLTRNDCGIFQNTPEGVVLSSVPVCCLHPRHDLLARVDKAFARRKAEFPPTHRVEGVANTDELLDVLLGPSRG